MAQRGNFMATGRLTAVHDPEIVSATLDSVGWSKSFDFPNQLRERSILICRKPDFWTEPR
jgi:hypothetical protein